MAKWIVTCSVSLVCVIAAVVGMIVHYRKHW